MQQHDEWAHAIGWNNRGITTMNISLGKMKQIFHQHKQEVETPMLYKKVHTAIESRDTKSSLLSMLDDNCFAYVKDFILDEQIIDGPEPEQYTGVQSRVIHLDGNYINPKPEDWKEFRIYVNKHPKWATSTWSTDDYTRHYLFFNPNDE